MSAAQARRLRSPDLPSNGATVTRPSRAIASLLLTPAALGGVAAADDIVVPRDAADIQQAITRARVGDRVIVTTGTYDDNLRMRSGVDVLGVETARVVLRARNPANATVTFETVTGSTLAGFTLDGGTIGVQVVGSSGITIANSVVNSTAGTGVIVDGFSTALVRNVTFVNNAVAIERGSAAAPVVSNIFFGNARTIVATGGVTDNRANVTFNCYFRNADTNPAFGVGFQLGDPLFVDPPSGDFHLRQGSACIDIGGGTDAIDASVADAGAYGGATTDVAPFPVGKPTATPMGATTINVSWPPNLDYHVTNSVVPGGYRLHYALNDSVPPLEGTDAGGGMQRSPIDVGNVTTFTLANLAPTVATPGAPQLLSAEPRQNGAVLTWSAVAGATGYRVGYGVGSVDENPLDVGAVTTVTLGGLVDGTLYRFAVTARAQALYSIAVTAVDNTQTRHESALSTIVATPLGDALAGPRSNELTAIPGPTIPVPDLPDEGGCFIATSAFNGADRAEVTILRDFRDRYLLPTRAGRAFVAAYYRASPAWSRKLDARPEWKPWVRAALTPAVGAALVAVGSSPAQKSALAVLLVAFAAIRVRRRLADRARQGASIVARTCVALLLTAAGICGTGTGTAHAQQLNDTLAITAPRWSIWLDVGKLEPDIDSFELFYGDKQMDQWAVGFAYAFRPWLEVGAEVGRARADGVGILAGQGVPGGQVDYTLWPAHAFVRVRGLFRPRQLFVPYLGVGAAAGYYEEEIDGQEKRTGTSELGAGARVGLEMYLNRLDGDTRGAYGDGAVKQTYLFLEWQQFSTKQNGAELGGDQWVLGIKLGFGRDAGRAAR